MVDEIEKMITSLARRAGFTVSVKRSAISQSRYIFISDQMGKGFDPPKSVRARYCAQVGSFPRRVPLCVRVSDHRGWRHAHPVHIRVHTNRDAVAGLEKVQRALEILGAGMTDASGLPAGLAEGVA